MRGVFHTRDGEPELGTSPVQAPSRCARTDQRQTFALARPDPGDMGAFDVSRQPLRQGIREVGGQCDELIRERHHPAR